MRQKWDERYGRTGRQCPEPNSYLVSLAKYLPPQGRALDVAGGTGRHALWLAARGLDVTLTDISSVGLMLAKQTAQLRELALHTECVDLQHQSLPEGPWHVVVSILFLQRNLFAGFFDLLIPGGKLIVAHPTVTNLERHKKPHRKFLLERGELQTLAANLHIIEIAERWTDDGFHHAEMLAERPR